MRIVTLDDTLPQDTTSIVTIGNFDGVHRGHALLLQEVVTRAQAQNKRSVAITFEPHTRLVLYPELTQQLLTTFEEKASLIAQLGIEVLVKIPFDKNFSTSSADTFVEQILVDKLRVSDWLMGEGHTVGKERSGGKKFLHDALSRYHINTFTADLFNLNGSIISSTRIRKSIVDGQIDEAVSMLGHPYLISSKRVRGEQIGSKMGFPTFNFERPPSHKVLPPPGVYAAELEYDGTFSQGALYFGECATLSKREMHFEFHSFGFDGREPGTGEIAHLWIHSFIRADKVFAQSQELKVQIQHDIKNIQDFFSEEKVNAIDKRT